MKLSWFDNASNETGYEVDRMPAAGGAWAVLSNSLPPGTTSYTDSGLSHGSSWTYRVSAFNAYGNSSYAGPSTGTAT